MWQLLSGHSHMDALPFFFFFSLESSFILELYGSLFFITGHHSPIQATIQKSGLNS